VRRPRLSLSAAEAFEYLLLFTTLYIRPTISAASSSISSTRPSRPTSPPWAWNPDSWFRQTIPRRARDTSTRSRARSLTGSVPCSHVPRKRPRGLQALPGRSFGPRAHGSR
jgi:hypothetical protein